MLPFCNRKVAASQTNGLLSAQHVLLGPVQQGRVRRPGGCCAAVATVILAVIMMADQLECASSGACVVASNIALNSHS
jgi:hypothetical protein